PSAPSADAIATTPPNSGTASCPSARSSSTAISTRRRACEAQAGVAGGLAGGGDAPAHARAVALHLDDDGVARLHLAAEAAALDDAGALHQLARQRHHPVGDLGAGHERLAGKGAVAQLTH